MSAPTRAVLVPPRPNLGPDPYPQGAVSPKAFTAAGVGLVFGLLVILWVRRRLKKKRRAAPVPTVAPRPTLADPSTTRDWMIVWSDNVRDALVERFGPAWRAKTTEEISTDERLADALGSEQATQLLVFLNEADRAKFAPEADATWALDDERANDWRDWVTLFLQPPPDAKATTGSNGKPR